MFGEISTSKSDLTISLKPSIVLNMIEVGLWAIFGGNDLLVTSAFRLFNAV